MNNQTKLYLGIGLLAVSAYLLYGQPKKSFNGKKKGFLPMGCKPPLRRCPNNPKKCYDPNVNYVQNPCR